MFGSALRGARLPFVTSALACAAAFAACSGGSGGSGGDPATQGRPATSRPISLFVTGDVGGDTEQCGCKAHPMGGVARRAKIVRDRTLAQDGRALVLDAGDQLFKLHAISPRDRAQALETATFLARSMKMMNPDPVMAVGERDLALGLGTLRRIAAEAGVTLLSANLVHAKTGTAAFPAFAIVERGGVKIGLVGATIELDPKTPAYEALYLANGLEARPPEAAVADAARRARAAGAQVVVGLLHLGQARAREVLAKLEPGLVDLAVAGHDRLPAANLEAVGAAAMVMAGERGKWLLALELEAVEGAKGVLGTGAIAAAKKQLEDLDRRIADYSQPPPGVVKDPAHLEKIQRERAATVERLKKRRADVEADLGRTPSDLRHRGRVELIPLDLALPEDPEVLAALNAYKARLGIVNAGTGAAPAEGPLRYLGTDACRGCHLPAYTQWSTTQHAKAWATMERTKQVANLDCIGCHTTGFDRPGGPSGLQDLARFHDVGCESCHGPGSAHAETPAVRTPIQGEQLTAACSDCHRAAADQKPFVLSERLPKIVGPGHGAAK